MALLDEVKVALRVSTNDSGIEAQITRLIAEAQLDLCKTADVSEAKAMAAEPDALIKGAICCYCAFVWTTDTTEKQALKACYDDYKAKLAMSSAYSGEGGGGSTTRRTVYATRDGQAYQVADGGGSNG